MLSVRNILWGLALLSCVAPLSGSTPESRVYAYLTLEDYQAACDEAQKNISNGVTSQSHWELYLRALAKSGRQKEMLRVWNQYCLQFPDEKFNRSVLEEMAWGVIENSMSSSSPIVRLYAALGAFFGRDARGVKILETSLQDSNVHIRSAALQLSSQMRDASLKEQVYSLLKNERNSDVRVEVIRASGRMKIFNSQPHLINIIANERSRAEEKSAAIEALVALLDKVSRTELKKLTTSPRAGLRQLACRVVYVMEEDQDFDLLIPLLNDKHSDVRLAALQTLTLRRANLPVNDLIPLTKDRVPEVAITASWALMLRDSQSGQNALKPWLTHDRQKYRLLAVSALSAGGKYGIPLLQQTFRNCDDPYVRMNVGLALLGQRVEIDAACDFIYQTFMTKNEKWMKVTSGPFEYIGPSRIKHSPVAPNYPEAVNQLARLEVLNALAIMDDPSAPSAIRSFLKERSWGVTGTAAALLLTEGDESAIDIIEPLLDESNRKVSTQAALILALWGKNEKAVKTLINSYQLAGRDMKERILEGLGHIGDQSAIPFLTEHLEESVPTLRIIAATALLQCLYH